MKNIILIISLFTATLFAAMTNPPTDVENQYLELKNRLTNAGFEGGVTSNFTASNGTLASISSNASEGKRYLRWTPSGTGTLDLKGWAAPSNSPGMAYAKCDLRSLSTASSYTLSVYNSSDSVSASQILPLSTASVDWKKNIQVSFLHGSSNKTYWIRITGTSPTDTIEVDNCELGYQPASTVFLNANSDLASCTITGTWTTNTTYAARCAQRGDYLYMEGSVSVSGAPTSATLTITLPTGYVMDSSKVITGYLGELNVLDNGGSAWKHGRLYYASTTTMTATYASDSTNFSAVTQIAPMTFGAGDNVTFRVLVPIVGWTTGYTSQGNILQNPAVSFSAYKNGGSITANTTIPTWTATLEDTAGSFNLSAGTFTVKYGGDYDGVLQLNLTGSSTGTFAIFVNGVSTNWKLYMDTATATRGVLPFQLKNLVFGDVITIQRDAIGTVASTVDTKWSMTRISPANSYIDFDYQVRFSGWYYGGSTSTICSSSPCTVGSVSGNIPTATTGLTVTRGSTGNYSINVPTGLCAGTTLSCAITAEAASGNPLYSALFGNVPAATTFGFSTRVSTSAVVGDSRGSFMCTCARR